MRRYDFSASRLYVETDLAPGALVTCRPDQVNYLRNVLRLGAGDRILIFNGRDGEWRAPWASGTATLSGRVPS